MVKHNQTIHRLLPTISLSVFDHFLWLEFKGSILSFVKIIRKKYLYFSSKRLKKEPQGKLKSLTKMQKALNQVIYSILYVSRLVGNRAQVV